MILFFPNDIELIIHSVLSSSQSDLSGKGGLRVNDVIKSINGCRVREKQDWKRCLVRSIQNPVTGYCLTPQFIEEERFFSLDPDADCCGEDEGNRNLCFESGSRNKYCFPARILLKRFRSATCSDLDLQIQSLGIGGEEGNGMGIVKEGNGIGGERNGIAEEGNGIVIVKEGNGTAASSSCSPDRCFKPYAVNSNLTKLLVMEREDKDDFLFWGFPGELYSQITVTTFKPRSSWIPPSILVHFIDSFLR